MSYLISSILLGFSFFPFFAVCFTLPILLLPVICFKKFNFVKVGLDYAMILYFLCMFSLVFFPLPTASQAMTLYKHNIQLIPFHFVADIIRETPFVITNPHTYVPAILHQTVLQVVFNVLMTIPFGMFLCYYFGLNSKKVILFSFLLTLFIEVGQLTGLFFIYHGSYRLCDVDDLMANTLGGYLGYKMISSVEQYVPSIKAFDIAIAFHKKYLPA